MAVSQTAPRPKVPEGRIRNLRLTVEYDGSRYRGWQIQSREKTVAGVLTWALGNVTRERVTLFGAGRTDAGVHAEGQVANFRCHTPMPAAHLVDAINREIPPDINVLKVEDVPMDFHARHSARQRRYRYQLALRRSAFLKPYSWWIHDPPDREMLRVAATYLVGRHDYTPFSDRGRKVDEPIVEVYEASFQEQAPLLHFRIAADHFLPRMVRRIVGVLVRIGHHEFPPERIKEFLAGSLPIPDDTMAPAAGLFLEKVEYL
jgi:tRNA pseudouridine38-40 synthase